MEESLAAAEEEAWVITQYEKGLRLQVPKMLYKKAQAKFTDAIAAYEEILRNDFVLDVMKNPDFRRGTFAETLNKRKPTQTCNVHHFEEYRNRL